jgi:hypothetical protein
MNVNTLSVRQLTNIKIAAETDLKLLHDLRLSSVDPSTRLQLNGPIACRMAIIDKANYYLSGKLPKPKTL